MVGTMAAPLQPVAEINYHKACFGFKTRQKPTLDVLDQASAAARAQVCHVPLPADSSENTTSHHTHPHIHTLDLPVCVWVGGVCRRRRTHMLCCGQTCSWRQSSSPSSELGGGKPAHKHVKPVSNLRKAHDSISTSVEAGNVGSDDYQQRAFDVGWCVLAMPAGGAPTPAIAGSQSMCASSSGSRRQRQHQQGPALVT